MRHAAFRLSLLSTVLSAIAPSVLAAAGLHETDLLVVVFVPSALVGWITAWVASRRAGIAPPWTCDTRRMP